MNDGLGKEVRADNQLLKQHISHIHLWGVYLYVFHSISKWPPERSLTLWDDQGLEMVDFSLKQNSKYDTSVDKIQNSIIFNRLSVIQTHIGDWSLDTLYILSLESWIKQNIKNMYIPNYPRGIQWLQCVVCEVCFDIICRLEIFYKILNNLLDNYLDITNKQINMSLNTSRWLAAEMWTVLFSPTQ